MSSTTDNKATVSAAGEGKTDITTKSDSVLVSSQGRTTIADTVVSKIAGIATREVQGVHAVGGGASRAIGALRERIPGARVNQSQGVSVEVGERQAAVDIDIVADYGVSIADLAAGIRRNVINAVERMTGLEVTEVNIVVHDIFLDDGSEDEETTEATSTRVQ
ncbi:Asp23/Gls24 family envelope stress response protein [Rhodococcus sp. IEGM 1330]|uniref:Asp23/Gls24 family envelope stress response protein n=1 Tax=Rhodococcus sp. IEGM 1330 TaxID=3082225 RepID=UPI002954FB5E|nr:Asp23/Gls24 family envelope stress response protein [Rhodococcus sp. IEGM 1330]MDV8021055.1 Asp23/Gls24 family envelope stress response protein [Rhodococcus sp. IEGM 1330]